MRIVVIIIALFISSPFIAQKKKPVEYILEVDNYHKRSGWFIGGGVTYTYPRPSKYSRIDTLSSETYYNSTYDAKAGMGWNVEVGGWKIFDVGPIHFLDYSVNYRTFKGKELYDATEINQDPLQAATITGDGLFNQSFVGLNVGVNRIMGINRYVFLLHNLNVNGNYQLSNDVQFNAPLTLVPVKTSESNIEADLSYKFGVGYRVRKGLWTLTASIPLFSSYDTQEVLSRKELIHSQYHPLVFTLRYSWLKKKDGLSCPDNKKPRNRGKEKLFENKIHKTKSNKVKREKKSKKPNRKESNL